MKIEMSRRGGRGFDWRFFRDRQVARKIVEPTVSTSNIQQLAPEIPNVSKEQNNRNSMAGILGLSFPPERLRLPAGGIQTGPDTLRAFLSRIDGGPYPALRDLRGRIFSLLTGGEFGIPHEEFSVQLKFNTVQPDPFAPGSQVALRMPMLFPVELFTPSTRPHNSGSSSLLAPCHSRCAALCDWLLRRLHAAADAMFLYDSTPMNRRHAFDGNASGISVLIPSQHILERSAVVIYPRRPLHSPMPAPSIGHKDPLLEEEWSDTRNDPGASLFWVELRVKLSLPAFGGRRVDGRKCQCMIFEQLLPAACVALLPPWWEFQCNEKSYTNTAIQSAATHVAFDEEQTSLRNMLSAANLCAFIPNGSILPRQSGTDDAMLIHASRFIAGDADCKTLDVPVSFVRKSLGVDETLLPLMSQQPGIVSCANEQFLRIRGLGIPCGVTCIVGDAFHGKSTVLRALEVGIYNHTIGDGREFVVADPTAVKIRAEDRRFVAGVNISPFVTALPPCRDSTQSTENFCTNDASGATSQASNIVEFVAVGATTLLIDEDTAATNFMIRDPSVAALFPHTAGSSVVPFADKVRPLFTDLGVSTIIVSGATGHFFAASDLVVAMHNFQPSNVTCKAKELALAHGYIPCSGTLPFVAQQCDNVIPDVEFCDNASRRFIQRERDGRAFDLVKTAAAISPSGKQYEVRYVDRSMAAITAGSEEIDMSCVEQLVERNQTAAVAVCLAHILASQRPGINARRATVSDISRSIASFLHSSETFDLRGDACRPPLGTLSRPRVFECLAALYRLRTLTLS